MEDSSLVPQNYRLKLTIVSSIKLLSFKAVNNDGALPESAPSPRIPASPYYNPLHCVIAMKLNDSTQFLFDFSIGYPTQTVSLQRSPVKSALPYTCRIGVFDVK